MQRGEVVDGLYKIIQPDFGKGGNGTVHLARDAKGRPIILKFPNLFRRPEDLQHFKREYQNLLKFSHPNVARALHFGQHKGQFFIASEFIDGKPFHEACVGLSMNKKILALMQALEGLAAIHEAGMLHLDMKATNLLMTRAGEMKIIDFGLTIAMDQFFPKKICGTPMYLPPELASEKSLDQRADLFSFGVLAYFCLTGKYPFEQRRAAGKEIPRLKEIIKNEKSPLPPSRYNREIPRTLDQTILRLLKKNPTERFATARAVIHVLQTHHPEEYREGREARGSYLIPRNNKHIGRKKEQALIDKSLDSLIAGKQPKNNVFWIVGEEGMGKSHLLHSVKGKAERFAEKIAIHSLELPSQHWMEEWIRSLHQKLSEEQKPLLILIDNFDCLENRDWASFFLKEIKFFTTHPVLFLFTTTAETLKAFPPSGINKIFLKPFSKNEVEEFLESTPALQKKKIPPAMVRMLYQKTKGNPQELQETLLHCDSQGLVFNLDGQLSLAQAEVDSLEISREFLQLPTSTKQRLERFWGSLSGTERQVWAFLAVWHHKKILPPISRRELQKYLKQIDVDLSPVKDDFSFPLYSDLPDFIYEKLPPEERKRLHQIIADRHPLHRALGNSSKTEAIRLLLKMGREALYQNGNPNFSGYLLDRAFQCVTDGDVKLSAYLSSHRISCHYFAGEQEQAIRLFERFQKKSGSPLPLVLRALLVIAVLPSFLEKGHFQRSERLLHQTVKETGKVLRHSHLFLTLRNFEGFIFYTKYYLQNSGHSDFLKRAEQLFLVNEKEELRLHPLQRNLVRNNLLGLVYHAQGKNKQAIAKLKTDLKKFRYHPHVSVQFTILFTLAESLRILKKFSLAMQTADRALAIAKKTGQGKWIAYAHELKGLIHQARGIDCQEKKKEREAKAAFAKALQEMTCRLGAAVFLQSREERELETAVAFIAKGQCLGYLHQWDQAFEHFRAALEYRPKGPYLPAACIGLGECYLEQGNAKEAKKYLKKGEKLLQGLPSYIAKPYAKQIAKAYGELAAR